LYFIQQCIFCSFSLLEKRMSWGGWVAITVVILGALMAGALVVQRLNEARDAIRFPAPGQLVEVRGRRLHLLCKGSGDGPTVVIEQGLAGPSILWWPVQDGVATFARVCTYDRAGYQWSDAAATAQTAREVVADLDALLTAAGVPRPYVLVGHSFGGPLVRLFVQQHPNDVVGLVLVDTPDESVLLRASFAGYSRGLARTFTIMRLLANFGLMRWIMGSQEQSLGLPPALAGVLGAKAGTPRFFRTAVENSNALDELAAELRSSGGFGSFGDRPLSVITHGVPFLGPAAVLEDGWMEGQRTLAALSTNSELIVAAKSNHMINNDEPQVVIDAIRRVHAAARGRTRL
jgi:pimeloyl-ACP methyl ester carboxylesterase